MDIYNIVAGVFAGNLLTLAFVWGAQKFARAERDNDVPWLPYAAVMLPIIWMTAIFFINSGPPQILGAITAQ